MVFILRASGGHVDGSTCFGVQTSSAQPPYSLTGMFNLTSDALNMIPNAGMHVVIYHLSDTFSNHEMILIFVLWCAFEV